ncbi:ExbD/TolR family protein [Candidatus Endomicrobiellum agilis]|uniref:ExbD/TolR family protein n=1 Tax=Candidatus Endomicrobiellum agilis TaxID=3238957 RepID=UPI00357F9157|nr:biopolymer transporter ExbD [Endomicrobium sp.]
MALNRKRNAVMSEINITPFTDVVLVLLIIFMITTPMLMQPSIKVNLPKTQISDSEDASNIEVLISKNGYVYVEGKQIHNSNVESVIRDMVSSHTSKTVVIKGDKEVQYDYIIQFMDKAKKAGAIKFALAVDNNN